LGGFLAIASTTLVGLIRWPIALSGIPVWIWWLVPIVYVMSDFSEDAIIFAMLRWPSSIQGVALDILACVRATKIASVTLSIIQVLLLCLLSYIP
jgi:hypothetical protein